jgi:hypothetical protein
MTIERTTESDFTGSAALLNARPWGPQTQRAIDPFVEALAWRHASQ